MSKNRRWILLASVVVVTAAIASLTTILATQRHPDRANPDAAVDALVPQPPIHPTMFEQVMAARNAVRRGDFASAERDVDASIKASRVGRWSFSPFAYFVDDMTAPAEPAFLKQLDAWVALDPGSATAHLVRADYESKLAWWARGNGFVSTVDPAQATVFATYTAAAAHDVAISLKQNPHNPWAWFLNEEIQRDAGGDVAQAAAFRAAIQHYPNYYPLYSVRLDSLQPKWFGSVDAMRKFVSQYAGNTAADSPMRLLYIELYGDLLDTASTQCDSDDGTERRQCLATAMAQLTTPATTQAAQAATTSLLHGGQLDALNKVGTAINAMISIRDAAQFSLPFLQTAATALHSDFQLTADDTSHNNYMIDQEAAIFWRHQGIAASAETLAQRAISDLHNTHFASINDEDSVRAEIYENLLHMYADARDYAQVARYGGAVYQLQGGPGSAGDFNRQVCEALLRLKRYDEGLRVCSASIDASRDMQVLLFRAQILEAMGRKDEAIRDYTEVAASSVGPDFRGYAAIELSNLVSEKHDYAKALAVLDRYVFLFPIDSPDTYDEASYYNDRCYNEMYLNRLDDALRDCNMSIGFQPLPDAMKKQAEISRRLAAQGSSDSK